jgi:uncharacterized protein
MQTRLLHDPKDSAVPGLTREALVAGLKALRSDLEREGVSAMALFGSRARGDNQPGSDIDLMIDVTPGRKFSLLDLVGVAHMVEDRFGLPANIFMRRSLDPDSLSAAVDEEEVVF